jgi:hypothetical protein
MYSPSAPAAIACRIRRPATPESGVHREISEPNATNPAPSRRGIGISRHTRQCRGIQSHPKSSIRLTHRPKPNPLIGAARATILSVHPEIDMLDAKAVTQGKRHRRHQFAGETDASPVWCSNQNAHHCGSGGHVDRLTLDRAHELFIISDEHAVEPDIRPPKPRPHETLK